MWGTEQLGEFNILANLLAAEGAELGGARAHDVVGGGDVCLAAGDQRG